MTTGITLPQFDAQCNPRAEYVTNDSAAV